MKTTTGMTAVMVLVVAIFTLLGLAEANHMLIFGLLLAIFSGLLTIALAAAAKGQLLRATFEPTAAVAEYKSSTFTNITGLHNYPSPEHRELASLRQDLRALQEEHDRTSHELAILKTHLAFRYPLLNQCAPGLNAWALLHPGVPGF
jgi:hypothetical protein